MVPAALVSRLQEIVGPSSVLTRPEDVVVYEQDAFLLSPSPPDVVVLPGSPAEVAAVVRVAADLQVPVIPRGAGTGLSGGAIPTEGGLVVVLTRLNHILEIDARSRYAVVEAGVINAELNKAAASFGLFFAPDPGSQTASTIGGNLAHNAGGAHCLAYGVTTNHVLGLEVVFADGTMSWVGGRAADASGYDLPGVLVGAEGTLGIVTRGIVRLLRKAEGVRTLLAIFDAIDPASQAVSELIASGVVPTAVEMLDALTLRIVEEAVHAGYPIDAGAVLLIESEGLRQTLDRVLPRVRDICLRNGAREIRTAATEEERVRLWKGRKEAFGALGRVRSGIYLADVTVPRHQLPAMMRRLAEISEKYGIPIANFFHAGDGNLHPNLLYDLRAPHAAAVVKEAGEEIIRVCLQMGGTITGEHGVGVEKREYMRWMFGEADLLAMQRVKQAFDPAGLMNPGKLLPVGHPSDTVARPAAVPGQRT